MVDGFPNMMMIIGPHMALGNIPRSIEHNVEWVTNLLRHVQDKKITRVEPTAGGSEDLDRSRQVAGRRGADL